MLTRSPCSNVTRVVSGRGSRRWRVGSFAKPWSAGDAKSAGTLGRRRIDGIVPMPGRSRVSGSRACSRWPAMKRTDPGLIRRGDVLWLQCDPSVGAEPRKTRTCVVVSNDRANRAAATLTVIPTIAWSAARAERYFNVDLRRPRSSLTAARVANVSQVTAYDRARVVARAGRAGPEAMREIDRALAVHL